MRINLFKIRIWVAAVIFTLYNISYSQSTLNWEEVTVDMEEYDFSNRSINKEKPKLYRLSGDLGTDEIHTLDSLSLAERRFIEESFDPPLVGVIRNLAKPLVFGLDKIAVPAQGETSIAGGRLSRIHEDTLLFTTRFQSGKADQLRVFFESGYFPAGVRVNVFGDNDQSFQQKELSGRVDEYGFYTTSVFSGSVTLQVVIPVNNRDERSLSFTISKIIHVDNRYIKKENFRDCYIDANCPYANEFNHINQLRRSTAFLYFPVGAGYGICSGGLLNDARAKDAQPYLLTANHCFDTQTSAAGLEAVFYYYSKACNNDTVSPGTVVVNGANLIATNPDTDFTLVLLRNLGGDVYLGWTTNNVSNGETLHAVHHPGGQKQKYSRYKNLYTPEYDCNNLPISRYFHTTTYAGQSSPGSSGSVIVNNTGHVVGQLFGTCHNPSWDECNFSSFDGIWGKFQLSYPNNNLQYWLNSSLGGNGAVLTTIPSASWDFGTADVGGASTFPFSVNNTGTRPNNLNLEVYNITVTGPDAADFSIIGGTSFYLSPGFGGTFHVRFSPSSAGPKSAQLVITHNADNVASPKVIPLTGYGNPCSGFINMGYGGFANAQLFTRSGTGIWNTVTNSACGYSCPGVEQIYTFTAPETGIYRLEVPLTNNTWVDYMYRTGTCSASGWTCIDDVYSQGTYGSLNLIKGVQYQLLLDPETTSPVTHAFYIAWDPCQNIINIGGTGSSYQQTYNGGYNGSWYTNSSTPCGTLAAGLEQIYSFTPITTGNYSVQVSSASGSAAYLWKPGSCSSTGWNCIQNISGPGKYGTLALTAFTTYYFMVVDVDNTPGDHKFYIDFAEAPGTWKGTVSNDWHNPANWSAGILPTSTMDVIIPWSPPYQMPVISNNNASCRFLVINPSATLTISNYNLNVNLDVTIHGNLVMNGASGKLNVLRDVFWENGSVANFSAAAECYVNGDWRVYAGASCNLAAGTVRFTGTTPSIIANTGFGNELSFNNVNVEKTGGQTVTIAGISRNVTIKGNLFVQNGAQLSVATVFVINIHGNISCNGLMTCTAGTVTLKGTNQFIKPNVNDYFHHLEFNQTGTVLIDNIQTSILNIKGNFTITSGILNAQNRTLQVGRDWKNTAGDAAFQETGSRVVFNGSANQNMLSSETFDILELNSGGLLRINNPGFTVSCSQYDWTSGGIEVLAGTFTASDLFDNGIFGNYTLHEGGVINLTNDQWIDLNGNLLINGGQFNVYGGSADSDWPYAANGSLTMYDGVLDFKNRGIRLLNSTSYTFDNYIAGGIIRTVGSINNMNPGFVNLSSTFEMYGSADASIATASGCQFGSVIISKGAFDGEVTLPYLSDREDQKISQTRASTVFVYSNQLRIDGDLILNAGTFDLNASNVNCFQNVTIHAATLKMTQATDILSTQGITWNEGSQAVITHGTISATNWKFANGTHAKLGTGNMAIIRNLSPSEDDDAEFGNLTILPSSFSNPLNNPEVTVYYPTRVAGNLLIESGTVIPGLTTDLLVGYNATIQSGVILSLTDGADFSVVGNLILEGTLNLSPGSVADVYNDISLPGTGVLNAGAGSFVNHGSNGMVTLNGTMILTTGTIEFPNRSVTLSATFSDQISGGTLKLGRSLTALSPGTFQPSAGTVEFINLSSGDYMHVIGGNYFRNVVIDKPRSSIMVNDDIMIKGNLDIVQGAMNANHKTISVAGNWNNILGDAGFEETTGRVIFNGTGAQFCSSENFHILEINKPSQLLYNEAGDTIQCQVYDWTSGGIFISPGQFTAFDLADNGLFGSFAIYNGTMNLYQDISQYVDFNGNITIGNGGNLNIYGGNGDSWWPYLDNGSLTMTGGTLDIKDNGIYFNEATEFNFTGNISGGTIKTPGNFIAEKAGFMPAGGTVELYGSVNRIIYTVPGSALHHLTINKSGGAKDVTPIVTKNQNGSTIMAFASNEMNLGGDLQVNGNLNILNGKLNAGSEAFTLTCNGAVAVNDGGTLDMGAASVLKLNSYLTVTNGGTFLSSGTAGQEVLVTRVNAGKYAFSVQPGGNLSAEHTVFEHMGSNGIFINEGAMIDPAKAFNYCTFRMGQLSGVLLTMNSGQELTSTGAIFPANTWSGLYNVAKTVNTGSINFTQYNGAYAGPVFENDPFNRILWGDESITHNISLAAGWIGLSSYVMPADNAIGDVFDPISSSFIIAQTMTGAYYPSGGMNTILNWESQSAYKVKMNSPATLPIVGIEELNKTYNLTSGWNLVPVISAAPVDVVALFSGTGLVIAKDIAGVGVYWPDYGINTIGNLLPGSAYYALMNTFGAVTFPSSLKNGWNGELPAVRHPDHPWNKVNMSPSSHLIAIEISGLNGLMAGDIIGVFGSNGDCYGFTEITSTTINAFITAYADDELTVEKDGFGELEPMAFKVYRPSTGESDDVEVEYHLHLPQTGYFTGEGLSAIKMLKFYSTGIGNSGESQVGIYPNPTDGLIWLTGIDGFCSIEIIGGHGTSVKTISTTGLQSLSIDISGLSSGIYQVRISGVDGIAVKRLIRK